MLLKFNYIFTPAIVRALMTIEAARQAVTMTTLPVPIAERLRQQARVRSTHYSTRIEGNRLTHDEAQQVVIRGYHIPGRERDMQEVRNYYRALQQIETWAESQTPITEELINRLHALVFKGPRLSVIGTLLGGLSALYWRIIGVVSCVTRLAGSQWAESWMTCGNVR